MHNETLYIIAAIGLFIFLAHIFDELFKRTRFPDVILLIALGVIIGPVLGLVDIDTFGIFGPVITTVTLVIILFEEGGKIKLSQILKTMRQTTSLVLVGFIVTMAAIAASVALVSPFNAPRAFMLGAVLASISPAIVMPMLRGLKLQKQTTTILFLESAMLDVISIVVALAFLDAYVLGRFNPATLATNIFMSFTVAILIGLVTGYVWSIILHKVRDFENDILLTPAFLFIVFGVTKWLGFSGFIAALVFGITVGNAGAFNTTKLNRLLPAPSRTFNIMEKTMFAEIGFLLKVFFFIYLGIGIRINDYTSILVGLGITLLIFALRLPIVRLCVSKQASVFDASVMSVTAPKGLAVVALASFVAQSKISGFLFFQDVSYSVVLFSIALSAILIPLVEKAPLRFLFGFVFRSHTKSSLAE